MENKNNAQGRITGKTWTLRTITVKELAAMLENLPPVQRVRGSVWSKEVADDLVNDIKDGLYIPPLVVVADGGNIDGAALVDGQQRATSIVEAWKAGLLTGDETVVIAIEQGRTIEDAFAVLNIGVPVGAALVSAMGMGGKVGDAIVQLAAHPYFDGVKWTGAQGKRTERASFAATCLAIFAGWTTPSSNTSECSAWLTVNGDNVTDDVIQEATAFLDGLDNATATARRLSLVKGKDGAPSRKILSLLRRKNMFSTTCGACAEGASPVDCVTVWGRYDELLDGQSVNRKVARNGKVVDEVVTWPAGKGSSGDNAEYDKRLVVFRVALARAGENPVPVESRAEANAAADVADIPTADIEKSLGFKVKEG